MTTIRLLIELIAPLFLFIAAYRWWKHDDHTGAAICLFAAIFIIGLMFL